MEVFLDQNAKSLPKGELKIKEWDEKIVRLAIKLNKSISDIMQEPFEFVMAMVHTIEFDEQMKLAGELIEYFKNNNQSKK